MPLVPGWSWTVAAGAPEPEEGLGVASSSSMCRNTRVWGGLMIAEKAGTPFLGSNRPGPDLAPDLLSWGLGEGEREAAGECGCWERGYGEARLG